MRSHPQAAAGTPKICLGSRRWATPPSSRMATLSPEALQGLADLLPVLLCGEESAEHVFAGAAEHASASLNPAMRAGLAAIADDEHRHGLMLLALRNSLPCTQDSDAVQRSARFLKSLASADLKTHLTRVSALDAGVCIVLAEVTRPGTPIAKAVNIAQVFSQIRRDEGRHVRISRQYAQALGVDAKMESAERRSVIAEFCALLTPSATAFTRLGVDAQQMLQRLDAFSVAMQADEAALA